MLGDDLHPGASPPNRLTMTSIETRLNQLGEEFEFLGDWEERYRYVIELGKELAPLTDGERIEGHKVRGCASQVWLVTEPQADGTVQFRGDSDAHIVRGLIAILLTMQSGKSAREIFASDPIAVFDELGFREHLTPQRSNGLRAMVERIRNDARETLAAAS